MFFNEGTLNPVLQILMQSVIQEYLLQIFGLTQLALPLELQF